MSTISRGLRSLALRKHRLNKYVQVFLSYGSWGKLSNLAMLAFQKANGSPTTRPPAVLNIDVTNACNLKCPFCPTGMGTLGRPTGRMSMEQFQAIIDELGTHLFMVNFYIYGDPLLHKNIYEMIEYASSQRIATSLSTNFNIFSKEDALQMVGSGLDYLTLSIDGASQDTYAKYRVGGDFDRVMENLHTLLRVRKEARSPTPFVDWKFIVFRHNEHEIDKARALAKTTGVDRISFEGGIVEDMGDVTRQGESPHHEWLPRDPEYHRTAEAEEMRCRWLWYNAFIHWDGRMAPCCWVSDKAHDFGEFVPGQFLATWNNNRYQAARRLFQRRPPGKSGTICDSCVKTKNWHAHLNGASRS